MLSWTAPSEQRADATRARFLVFGVTDLPAAIRVHAAPIRSSSELLSPATPAADEESVLARHWWQSEFPVARAEHPGNSELPGRRPDGGYSGERCPACRDSRTAVHHG